MHRGEPRELKARVVRTRRAWRVLFALSLVWPVTSGLVADRAAAMCCACSGGSCGAGFCADGIADVIACANLCFGAGCANQVTDTTDLCEGGCSFASPVATATPSQTRTHTGTPTESPTPSPTVSRTNTPTSTPTRTPTRTPTSTPENTFTPVPTFTPQTCCEFPGPACASVNAQRVCNTPGILYMGRVCRQGGGACVTVTPTWTPANTDTPTNTPTATPTLPMNVDPYKCYRIKPGGVFRKRTITLEDAFGKSVTTVIKPFFVCRPSVRTGPMVTPPVGPLLHPNASLVCYKLRDDDRVPKSGTDINSRNDLEAPNKETAEKFEILRSNLICMPSTVELEP